MRHFVNLCLGLALLAISGAAFAQAGADGSAGAGAEQANPIAELPWQVGPATGKLGSRATIEIPEGYAFLGPAGAVRFNELNENPPSGIDEYIVAPLDLHWAAYFSFSDTGYVKDDETLDPDDLLSSIRDGAEAANAERRKRGWDEMDIVGWSFKPQYDKQINALEWAILGQMKATGRQVVNYNTRLLGRRGVMEVVVVADPDALTASVADFKGLVPGYAFAAGEKYAEFREGDRVAEYGLAALITGGAVAVAAKKGWLAAIGIFLVKMWKLVVVGLVALGAAFRKRFTRRQGNDPQP